MMKPQLDISIVFFLFFALVNGCNSTAENTAGIARETEEPIGLLATQNVEMEIVTDTPFTEVPTEVFETDNIETEVVPDESPTPLSRLSPEESIDMIFDLMADNGACEVPCFLGQFIPGKTTKSMVDDYINQFVEYSSGDYYITVDDFSSADDTFASIFITKPFGEFYAAAFINFKVETEMLSLINFSVWPAEIVEDRGEKIFGNLQFDSLVRYYTLDNILVKFGIPSRILVGTYNREATLKGPYVPFSIVVHYPEQGLLIEYVLEQIKKGDVLAGCPGNGTNFRLYISDPQMNYELIDYLQSYKAELISELWLETFKPIQEVTNFSVEDFYATFSELPSGDTCVETQADLWP